MSTIRARTALLLAAATAACNDGTPAPPPGPPPSVLLISPDSLRVDRLRPWNPAAPATPHFERLAARGTLFTNAWASAPWTAPAMVSVMSGEFPPAHGVVYRDDTTPRQLPTLPRLLEARGYVLGNFSFFSQISYFRNLGLGEPQRGLREDRVAEAFAAWLGGVDSQRPFHAWLHLLETHLPYGATGYRAPRATVPGSPGLEAAQTQGTVPLASRHQAPFAPGDRERLVDLYDRDVAAMDEALGRILAALEDTGRLENTLIVFVADHGEELLDSWHQPPWIGHASTAAEARLAPQLLRVPLVLAGPGVPSGAVRDELVQPTDVLATVEALLGDGFEDEARSSDASLLRDENGFLARLTDALLGDTGPALAFFDTSPGGNLTPPELRGVRLQGVTDGACLVSTWLDARGAVGDAERTLSQVLEAPPWDAAAATPCEPGRVQRLLRGLEQWRGRQAERRLVLLQDAAVPPAPEAVDAFAESLRIVEPASQTVRWDDGAGQIAFAWSSSGAPGTGRSELGESGEAAQPGAVPAESYAADPPPPAARVRRRAESEQVWIEYRLDGPGVLGLGALAEVSGAFPIEQERIVFGPVPQGFWNDIASYSPLRIRVLDPAGERRSPWRTYRVEPVR